ncbi:uracil-DNA glycosylase family protein [Clostridium omnivorum]|uniref:Uracil-DNA glycosylase n=1 Tax=Clostridium omnivorum TaxID=1604902 RepID=A0ABQ5N1Y6_9CLOT|nr:uracil-DNA glycosylase family protein [Clostridium sp. E14]GLC29080.1 uracil-DNA glycosylase [Clostridium sp. E14]
MECNCERNCIDVNLEAILPTAKISSSNIKVLMISEALPKNLNDFFYTTEQAAFFKTTCQALDDAGYHIESISELNELGIYLTTAIKCSKKDYLVSAATIKRCSQVLEKEIEPFKNVKSIMCMGDFAIKSINYIFKRKYGANVIRSGSTYKIRKEIYSSNGIRFFPSYTQTGDSFNIEKSKRIMIAEDIRNAFEYAGIVKYK